MLESNLFALQKEQQFAFDDKTSMFKLRYIVSVTNVIFNGTGKSIPAMATLQVMDFRGEEPNNSLYLMKASFLQTDVLEYAITKLLPEVKEDMDISVALCKLN